MTLAVLQARMSSSRLPGKVLLPILGQPMLAHQIRRIQRARLIDHLVVATSQDVSDDPLAALCSQLGVDCFRGSLNDVLDRFYQCAMRYAPDTVVRLTGDCPLTDPAIIDTVIERFHQSGADYMSNTLQPTFPDGLDVEVFRFTALATAWEDAKRPSDREHVTPFIHRQPERFNVQGYHRTEDYSSWRWTVDEASDFELIKGIYEALYPAHPAFGMDAVLTFLNKHPEMASLNRHLKRNEGYQKSLLKDQTP